MGEFQVRYEGKTAVVSIDDGKANALTTAEFASLEKALDTVAASEARAVVLTGRAGYLSAGLNLKSLGTGTLDGRSKLVFQQIAGKLALTVNHPGAVFFTHRQRRNPSIKLLRRHD